MIRSSSDEKEKQQVKNLGQSARWTIEILYITHEVISYHCSLCTTFHEQTLLPSDHDIDWFRFTCNTCGEESKRTINLSRVLKGAPAIGALAPKPKIMAPLPSPSKETTKKGKKK